jgi:hypothetical protein
VGKEHAGLCAGHSDAGAKLDRREVACIIERRIFCVRIRVELIGGLVGERWASSKRDDHVLGRVFAGRRFRELCEWYKEALWRRSFVVPFVEDVPESWKMGGGQSR